MQLSFHISTSVWIPGIQFAQEPSQFGTVFMTSAHRLKGLRFNSELGRVPWFQLGHVQEATVNVSLSYQYFPLVFPAPLHFKIQWKKYPHVRTNKQKNFCSGSLEYRN